MFKTLVSAKDEITQSVGSGRVQQIGPRSISGLLSVTASLSLRGQASYFRSAARAGVGVLGEGSQLPPHQLGGREVRCK